MMPRLKDDTTDDDEEEEHFTVVIKRRKLRTMAAYIMFLGLGLSSTVQGPTLVNMRELLGTDTVHISMALSMTQGGYLAASVLCGLLFKRFDSELQFTIACFLQSISLILVPWSRDVYGYMVAMTVTGFGQGYLDTGGNAYILSLWNGHRMKDPILQGLHLIWSVGSMISPLLAEPFLVENAVNGTNCTTNPIHPEVNITMPYDKETWTDCDEDRDITLVRYAYVVVGCLSLVIAILYTFIYCILGHHVLRVEKFHTESSSRHNNDQPRCFSFGFLSLVFVFYFFYLISEGIGGGYLSLFVVEGLGWSVKRGALITASFWGAHGFGRVIGVPASYILPPKIMLYITIAITCIGYLILLFVHMIGDVAIYVAVMMAGMGVSTIFPSMLSWVSNFLSSTSVLSAVCLTGSCVGLIAGYPLIGGLIELLGYMWYVYSVVFASILLLVMFIIMQVYSLAGKPNKKSHHHHVEEEEMNPFSR